MSEIMVREYTKGKPAVYNAIDVNGGRGQVTASATIIKSDTEWECITIVPDTFHNRVVFLEMKRVKVFEKGAKGWKEIPRSYLNGFFESLAPEAVKLVPEPEELVISSIEDVLKMNESDQLKAIEEISKDTRSMGFLKELVKSPTLSDNARKLGEDFIGARR